MFIHIDMDYFFAQAEELRHPEYKGKVVVVCVYSGRTKDSGVVSTVNYEGRKYGIHSGQAIYQAKSRAPPDSVFLPVDHEFYGELSDKINEIVAGHAESIGRTSIDEWFVESENAEALAKMLKKEILEKIGMICSIGVSPSMLGAKMAADKSKPDGLLVLDAKDEKKLIEGSDVQKVIGIGRKTSDALFKIGVQKVADLKKLDKVAMVERFGKKTGAWLVALGEGRYWGLLEYGEAEQSEVSRIGTLKEKTRDVGALLGKIIELEKDNRDWLKAHNKFFRTIGITFVTEDMKIHTRSLSFKNPKGWSEDFREQEITLIRQFLYENTLAVRRIGIKFANLVDVSGQKTLANEFSDLLEF